MTEIIKLILDVVLLLSVKKLSILFLFSLISLFCVNLLSGIFDVMYLGLIKTLCSLSLIFCLSWFTVELICALMKLHKRHKSKREKEAKIFADEEKYRCRINIIRALLIYLPPEQKSLLRFIYSQSGHGAYIPCENEFALKLYEHGCLESRQKRDKRGYNWSVECFHYRVTSEIAEFLKRHMKDLGVQWGTYSIEYEELKEYQRAGKSFSIE